jgi:hypothetical protein
VVAVVLEGITEVVAVVVEGERVVWGKRVV